MTTRFNPTRALCLATVAAAVGLLSACQRADDDARTAERGADTAVANADRSNDAAKRAEAAADRVGQKMDDAAGKVASKVEDAAITAGVNAELAKDTQLSALRINVDTAGGKVVLTGKAPDDASRERATQLASGVKGVTGVDNRLEIGG